RVFVLGVLAVVPFLQTNTYWQHVFGEDCPDKCHAKFVLAVVPFLQTNTYWQHVFGVALIGAILALGLQLLVGMAGLLSLGQGAFYGIGAYVSAVLTLHFGVPFGLAFLTAGVVAAISSLLLVPIVKLPSSSLAVAT